MYALLKNPHKQPHKLSPASIQLVPQQWQKGLHNILQAHVHLQQSRHLSNISTVLAGIPDPQGLRAFPGACQSTWTVFAAQATREIFPSGKLKWVQQEEPVSIRTKEQDFTVTL